MTTLRNIRLLMACTLAFALLTASPVVAQDYARMSERSIMGTARYVGMGGAMTAIGGDPSAAQDNPAGLGLYQRTEVLFTFDYTIDRTWQVGTKEVQTRRLFMVPHASWVLSFATDRVGYKGVQCHNIMFSYRRLHTYNRTMLATADEGASLGALLNTYDIDLGIPYCIDPLHTGNYLQLSERGSANEYSFNWAMNISNQWYVGAGLQVQSYGLTSDAVYYEQFYVSDTVTYSNRNSSSLVFTGAGCNLSVGAIYRPLKWLRLGFSLQTPTLGSLTTYTSGKIQATTDSVRVSYAPDQTMQDKKFHRPLHTSVSVAFQAGLWGMAALQYDYLHQKGQDDIHSLRAGLEFIPVPGMYINAGYVYESTFKSTQRTVPIDPAFDRQDTYFVYPRATQYASVALGYRGKHVIVQGAYQYRWQSVCLGAHEAATPYDMRADTHRIVLTVGWHRN